MIADSPNIFKEKELVSIGQSKLSTQLGQLLQLSYTTVFVCLEGQALVSVNFKNYLLQKHDLLVLAEDSITRVLRTSSNFEIFYCLVHKKFASEVAYNLPNSLFLFLNDYPLLRPQHSDIPFLEMWIKEIEHIKTHCTINQHIMLRNHLQNLFLKVTEEMPPEGTLPRHQRTRKEMLCWQFWEMIGKYCTQERNVSFYADKLNITPYYLSQITKIYLTDAPKDLIDRQVILEIKALLTSTDISIKEIADQLNFEDTSYLGRYFKRHTGMTLSKYRR